MRRFRKITVDNSEYKWLFRFDDYDYQNLPYLLVIMCSCPASSLKIFFPIHEHFLLNSGLPAVLNGNAVLLNMNRPLFVSQIIEQCQKNGETFDHEGCRHKNIRRNRLQNSGYFKERLNSSLKIIDYIN